MGSTGSKKAMFDAVRKDITKLLYQPHYDDGSAGPVLVRLAWHSSGTYDVGTDTGGSNGAGMRYVAESSDPDNAGLEHARRFLEPVKAAHPWISYSDLWTLAGVEAIRAAGGPVIPWQGGRTDLIDDTKLPPRGRLPDAAKGAAHVRNVFSRMGFNDQETVALIGAHSMGRCHTERSGFDGQWILFPTHFTNLYYMALRNFNWREKTVPKTGRKQFVNTTGLVGMRTQLMMLPTDIALMEDDAYRVWVERYADDGRRFFKDFAAAFAKLLELGIKRDQDGIVLNTDAELGGYIAAPRKVELALEKRSESKISSD